MKFRVLTLLLSFFFACYAIPTESVSPFGVVTLKTASTDSFQVAAAIESVKARPSQPVEKKPVLFGVNFLAFSLALALGSLGRADDLYQFRKLVQFKSKRPRAPPL